MKNVQIFDLCPVNSGQKSFHGKAQVIMVNNNVYLRSYSTIVCGIRNGEFVRLWYGHSCTSMRHINAFRAVYGFEKLTSRQWFYLDVPALPISEVVEISVAGVLNHA
jgi:hypothetical protein